MDIEFAKFHAYVRQRTMLYLDHVVEVGLESDSYITGTDVKIEAAEELLGHFYEYCELYDAESKKGQK